MDDHAPNYLHKSFYVYEELAEAAIGWDLDFRQIDCGRFKAEVSQAMIGTTLLTRACFSRAFEQRGSPPKGLITFGVPADQNQHFYWRGMDVKGYNLIQFPKGAELYSVSKPGFDIYTVSCNHDLLIKAAETIGFHELQGIIGKHELFTPDKQMYRALRIQLQRMHHSITHNPSSQLNDNFVNESENRLICLLLMSLHSSLNKEHHLPQYLRHFALEKALSYIQHHQKEVISVSDLTLLTHVSERTLELAFKERFAITPKSYLKSIRLNGVHEDLWTANHNSTKIVDIANRWGFWHMSQFAQDYYRFFGELPSYTIRVRRVNNEY